MPTVVQLPSTSFPLSISAKKKKKGYIYIKFFQQVFALCLCVERWGQY